MDLEPIRTMLLMDKRAKEFNAFEWDGIMYRGFFPQAVSDFIYSDSNLTDFDTWIKQHYADKILVYANG